MNEELARYILQDKGYNFALSDVEEACEYLDHPELKEEDSRNYHGWADPYPQRCYCSAIGYTDNGRFYACEPSKSYIKLMNKIFPDYENKYGKPYIRKIKDDDV